MTKYAYLTKQIHILNNALQCTTYHSHMQCDEKLLMYELQSSLSRFVGINTHIENEMVKELFVIYIPVALSSTVHM